MLSRHEYTPHPNKKKFIPVNLASTNRHKSKFHSLISYLISFLILTTLLLFCYDHLKKNNQKYSLHIETKSDHCVVVVV